MLNEKMDAHVLATLALYCQSNKKMYFLCAQMCTQETLAAGLGLVLP